MPVVQVKEEAVKELLRGKPITQEDLKEKLEIKEGNFAIFNNERFIEVARIVNEGEIVARPDFVLN